MQFVYTKCEKNRKQDAFLQTLRYILYYLKNAIEKSDDILYNESMENKKGGSVVTLHQFLPDYGILPSAYFERSAISNPTELFWSDELMALLRLCGAKEEMISDRASDYERFLSLCSALPQLAGHPAREWIASVLKGQFCLDEIPTEENAKDVWRALCEHLLKNPLVPPSLVSGDWLCDRLTVPNGLPQKVVPVLNGNLLLRTTAKNATAWALEISQTVERFANAGCQKIVLQSPIGFNFVLPSLYHVDRALSLTKREREANNLLFAQLVREICGVAQKNNLLLVLVDVNNPLATVHLLEYMESCVGLPRLCWSMREAREAYALLDFTAKPHKNEILVALSYESAMTENELVSTLESWKMRYPIGRLCFVTARDLRQTPLAQSHIANMMKKVIIKI